jgi:tetraacyldisaccharide-1-P 4'-kinase
MPWQRLANRVPFAMLEEAGLTLAQAEALPDHYDFDSWRAYPAMLRC